MNANVKSALDMKIRLFRRGIKWWMRFTWDGRDVRESLETTDEKTAIAMAENRKLEMLQGKWPPKPNVYTPAPLGEAIEDYLRIYAKPKKVSWEDDQKILQTFASVVGLNTSLDAVTNLQAARFQADLLSKGPSGKRPVSGDRANGYVQTLKGFFNRQIEWGKAQSNPFKGLKLRPPKERTSYLEVGQISALVEACSPRLRPIVQVALLTGLRQGDIFNLRWDSIDFESRKISVVQCKTDERLVLHMGDALAGVLEGIAIDPDCPFVFHNNRKPIKRFGWVRTEYLKATKAAGIPEGKRRFHDLRHTVGTQLRFLGNDLQVIKKQLGHRNIKTTMRYAHVAEAEMTAAAEGLSEKLGSNWGKFRTISAQSAFEGSDKNLVPLEILSKSSTESFHGRVAERSNAPDCKLENPPSEPPEKSPLRRALLSQPKQQQADLAPFPHNFRTIQEDSKYDANAN